MIALDRVVHPGPRLRKAVFVAYAITLFTATHWPKLELPSPVPRTDLWLHVTAFCLWVVLLAWTGMMGSWRSPRTLLNLGAIGVLYAALDELLQKTPGLNRVFGLDDMTANIAGALLGTLIVACIGAASRLRSRRSDQADQNHR